MDWTAHLYYSTGQVSEHLQLAAVVPFYEFIGFLILTDGAKF